MKPTIKIDIEHVKESIQEKLSDNSELCKTIEYEIENQIATYDFTHKVAKEINTQVSTIVGEYFKFGDGYKILKEAIELSLNTLFKGCGNENRNKE